jgi:L-threonylcarbamoyladenylate synthase
VTARVVPDDADGRSEAIATLRAAGIVAMPTDTVYGIAVALSTPGGLERLFAAKQRPLDKGIVLLLEGAAQAARAGAMTPAAASLAGAFWPGGLTLVVPQRQDVPWPDVLTGGAETIALRVPDHETPRALARVLGPLPTTSANVSGKPEASTAAEIVEQLGEAIDLVLDGGPAGGGPPSTVVDCSGVWPTIVRPGAIHVADLVAVLERAGIDHDLREEQRAP